MSIPIEQTLPSLTQLAPNYLISLSHCNAISLEGEEQSKYLQGQVTCDINSCHKSSLTVGAHCNAQGKVFSAFRLINREKAHLLIQPQSSITASFNELKKFGVFAKVTIKLCDDLRFYALVGDQAQSLLNLHFSKVPDSMTPVVQSDTTTIVYIAGKQTRYLLIDTEQVFTEKLRAFKLPIYDAPVWDLLEITEGFPQLSESSIGEYVPQMLNLQAIHGISFTKGCYLGQETVARMQYLGKNKRALFSLTTHSNSPINIDDVLEKKLGDNWRKTGNILNTYQSDDGDSYIQAVLNNDIDSSTPLRLKSQPESSVQIAPLPYVLSEA